MATLDEIERALAVAYNKGDMDKARKLAVAVVEARKEFGLLFLQVHALLFFFGNRGFTEGGTNQTLDSLG